MPWTALIPFKTRARKSRLAGRLTPANRERLALAMFRHVAATLGQSPAIGRILVLSDAPLPGWNGEWIRDRGRGLNAELEAARRTLAGEHLLVIHADLPFLDAGDIGALTGAALPNGAIAPDRHATGTNALALPPGVVLPFAFGPDSFARHREACGPSARIIRRTGLSHDIDTPGDLDSSTAIYFDSLEQAH
jgi:2-phospho-L-lactate guanylyltransferase